MSTAPSPEQFTPEAPTPSASRPSFARRWFAAAVAGIVAATSFGALAPASADDPAPVQPAASATGAPTVAGLRLQLENGPWPTSHVQGIAVDQEKGFIYYSFTTLLVKTDLDGNIVGTVGGFTGHLGDLDINPVDGRVYGSLEYKAAEAFYIAIFDVDRIDTIGMDAQNSDIVSAVHLQDVVDDFTADMDGDGVFDGNIGDTADHRYGSSGIDGTSFGPAFGQTDGPMYLTVAHGIYSNLERTDNDHQVILQYDTTNWPQYEQPLNEAEPHRSGPEDVDGKYFVFTGNTRYGVQNLAYDAFLERWFMGVYVGSKPQYPNYSMFAVDADAQPVMTELQGLDGEEGLLIPLAEDGLLHEETGIRGWFRKADVGFQPVGNGLYYIAQDSKVENQQMATLRLETWTGNAETPFVPVGKDYQVPTPSPAPTQTVTAEPTATPTATVTATPTSAPTAAPGGDLYETPGFHVSDGRRWMTVCEPYSVTDRCWTYIWGTQVHPSSDGYTQVTGWTFNNLTYVASPRSVWADNPLGNTGTWTSEDGRQWRTECDTPATGRNGCRSYATATIIERTGNTYRTVTKEIFNNIVRFS